MDEKQDPSLQLGIAANLASHYGGQGRELLAPLSQLFSDALGDRTVIKWAGGFLSKKVIRGVTLSLADFSYTLEDSGGDPRSGPIVAKRSRVVRGIALKTEEIPVATWLQEVGLALEVEAQTNKTTHEALAGWVW